MWFNNKYGRCDHLFQDRFKSEIIETENYWLQCFHYILQGIYTINKNHKTYIPIYILNIYIKEYYRTTNYNNYSNIRYNFSIYLLKYYYEV